MSKLLELLMQLFKRVILRSRPYNPDRQKTVGAVSKYAHDADNETVDRNLRRLLSAAYPPVRASDELRQRIAGMTPKHVQHKRISVITRRIALTMAGTGVLITALLILFGVLSIGRRPSSALAQAIEAIKDAKTIHFVVRWEQNGRPYEKEVWAAGKDRFRQLTRRLMKGQLYETIFVRNGDKSWIYNSFAKTVLIKEGSAPPLHDIADIALEPLTFVEAVITSEPHEKLSMHEETDVKGRRVQVFTIEWEPTRRSQIVLDGNTNRLIATESQRLVQGQWKTLHRFDEIEYDLEIPEAYFTFEPPPGTRVFVDDWWKERRKRVIAQQWQKGWRLRIHAVEVADNGDLLVSVSRFYWGSHNSAVIPWGRAIGEQGQVYIQLPYIHKRDHFDYDLYLVLVFTPISSQQLKPKTVTVELHPYPPFFFPTEERHKDLGWMSFCNLPVNHLPPGTHIFPLIFGGDEQRYKGQIEEERQEAIKWQQFID